MKLEPGRASLSGRPDFLRPAPVEKAPVVPKQRKCCMCQIPDVMHLVDNEPHHTVTIELRWIEAQNEAQAQQKITDYLKARGWHYRFHLGKHAMERDICRSCLVRHQEIEQEFRRKKKEELNSSSNSESYYLALCGD